VSPTSYSAQPLNSRARRSAPNLAVLAPLLKSDGGWGELPQQQRLLKSVGGTLILEYPVVPNKGGGLREVRRIDSLLLPHVPFVTLDGTRRNVVDWRAVPDTHEELRSLIRVTPVFCVQAKNSRLGPYLLGQALFSRELLLAEGVTVERSIALCGGDVEELSSIARQEYGIEVRVDPLLPVDKEMPSLVRTDLDGVFRFWQSVGGTFFPKFPILNAGTRSPTRVDAVIVEGPTEQRQEGAWSSLADQKVTVVVSTKARVCMYSLGMAVFARALAQQAGARAKAVVIAKDHDSALEPLLQQHPGISVLAASEIS
jgi:hypothetical protein